MPNSNYAHIDLLVMQAREGNNQALWELFDYYQPIILNTIKKINKTYPMVEKDDLYSESAFVLKELCSKYDKDKSYFTYFLETRLMPYLISKTKSKYVNKDNSISIENIDDSYYIEYDFNINDYSEIHLEIEKLNEKDRKIIDLFYFKNLTQTECAVVLNISQAAFSKKLSKILDSLKQSCEKNCIFFKKEL